VTFARGLTFLVAAWVGLVITATVGAVLPWHFPAPDVGLLVVLFVGLSARGGLAGVCALAVAAGYLADLFGGAPKGLHMVTYAACALAARGASARILVRGPMLVAATALSFALAFGALLVALRTSLQPSLGWGVLRQVPFAALSTALVAPVVFRVLRRLDRRYTRDPRMLGAPSSLAVADPGRLR
jgi:hypothetical protein